MLCSQKPIKAQFIKTNRCALIWIFSIQSTVFYFSVLKISKPTFQQCCQMSRILSKTHVLLIEVNQGTIDLHKAMFMKTDLTKFGQKISYFSVLELSKSSFRLCHQKSGSLKKKHARLIEFNQCTIHVHKPICIDLAFFHIGQKSLIFSFQRYPSPLLKNVVKCQEFCQTVMFCSEKSTKAQFFHPKRCS